MPLSVGDKLGPYEILAPIGAGGMGEVYKARDTKLDRQVAIKVLPSALARDPERLARFEREAKVLASLNHPNIAQIYGIHEGIGESGTGRALVMELVPGATLKNPLPLADALRFATQIAEALEAAHDKGIVHRDLKPANIMITPAGVAKVLDFGLAAVTQPSAPTGGDPSQSPTLTMGMTQAGMIMGTAGYMSPEQAAGQPVDKRADIWAFGVVLREMLTGQRLFTGDTIAHILAAVLQAPIDFDKLPATTPRRVRDLLKRCLDRDARTRLRDIGEARIAIENVVKNVGMEPEAAVVAPPPPRFTWLPWGIAALLLIAALGVSIVHLRETPPEIPLITTSIPPPETTAFDFGAANNPPALSPDGKRMVFGARAADKQTALWVRPLASPTAQMLPGTEGAIFPFWSPDSRYVAFFAGGKLRKIDVSGGPALAIADAPNGRGGSWSAQGVIVFSPTNLISPLMKVAASGGDVTPATSIEATKSRSHRFPWFLPDARHFLFEDQLTSGSNDVVLRVGSLDSQVSTILGHANSNAVYIAGFLLFLRESTLMAQPFDEKKRVIQGEAVPVAEQVGYVLAGGPMGLFTVSSSGLLAYQTGRTFGSKSLTWFDRGGKAAGTLGEPGDFNSLELSSDRKSAAVSVIDAATHNQDIWIYDIARGLRTRLTFDPGPDRQPVWSPDGSALVFASARDSGKGLYRKSADGKGNDELLYKDPSVANVSSWSADGKLVLLDTGRLGATNNVSILPLAPEKPGSSLQPRPFHPTQFVERGARFSPDGHWVAYASNESSRYEVYVAPFPGPGGKRQISTEGGEFPRWRRDGKEIFYVGLDGNLMAAEVNPKVGSIDVGQVRSLGIPVPAGNGVPYDVSLDGQRFLVITEGQRTTAPPLTLVENWTALFKK